LCLNCRDLGDVAGVSDSTQIFPISIIVSNYDLDPKALGKIESELYFY